MTIQDFVGRLSQDDTPELLQEAWSVATSEQQIAFLIGINAELEGYSWEKAE